MAHLEKLSIRGVRSFDPDTQQEIDFLPLTIILGPNGAGKTTIVESLKYVTTGKLPPNCNAGQSFVHDVQLANLPFIRGQIRLRITDAERKFAVVTRSVQASLKRRKSPSPQVVFKQLNSVIKREGKSFDQKTVDVNSEVFNVIGVNRVLLDSVIFCHQEETNWPLSDDGKVLKEKLDDIFGTTGYVKVLDQIMKTREDELKKIRLLEKDLNYYTLLKREAGDRQKQVDAEKARLECEKAKIEEIDAKAAELKEKLADLVHKEANTQDGYAALSQIEASIAEKRHLAEEIEKTCSVSVLRKSKDQVDQELEHFDDNSRQIVEKKMELEAKSVMLEVEHTRLQTDRQKISADVAKINDCTNQIYSLIIERNNLIGKIDCDSSEFYSVISKINANADLSSTDRAIVIGHLKGQIEQLRTLANEKRASEQIQEFKLKQDLDSLKSMKSNASHEKVIWQKQLLKVEKDFAQLERVLGQSDVSGAHLKALDEKIVQYRCQLAKCGEVYEEEQTSIRQLESKRHELKENIGHMEQRIETAMATNKEKVEYHFHRSQRDEKSAKLEQIRMRHFEVYCQVGVDESPDFSDKLNEFIEQISGEYEQSNAKVTSLEKELCSKKSKLESYHELLSKRIKELDNHKRKFDGLTCGIHHFETFLRGKEAELQQLRDSKSNLTNLASVIESQIETISRQEMCPTCENDLSGSWTSKKSANNINKQCLLKTLESSLQNNQELRKIDAQIQEAERLHSRLAQLRSNFEAIQSITKDILMIKAELASLREQIGALQKSVNGERINLNCSKERVESLRRCLRDANDYDCLLKELREIDCKLQQFDPSKWAEGVDLDDLNCQLRMLQVTLQSTDKVLSDLQKESLRVSKEKMDIQSCLQNAERSKAEFERQEHGQLEVHLIKRKEITTELEELRQKICDLEGKSLEFDPQIDRLETQLRALTAESKQFEKDNQHAIYECQDKVKKLQRIFTEIDKYSTELQQAQLKTSHEYIEKLQGDIDRLGRDRRTLTLQLTEAAQGVANLELQKRELLDCQRYLSLKQSIAEQEEKLKEKRQQIGDLDFVGIKAARASVENELTVLKTKSTIGIERIQELGDQITKLTDELARGGYESAEATYKKTFIAKSVTEVACEDLHKYYKALEFSTLTFHKCKLEEINKLLKNFWEIAYQGKDIDHIKIVSEEEEAEEEVRSGSEQQCSYNYRVVMVKRGKETDMKGRCSAGQKVLASFIIRLALAVIFCRQFSVLTLDEPTTNLDKANIHSFARAVISLIKSNRHFQIIIITHDEEFLDCLDADTGEFYYKVFKNDKGYSTIVRKSINEDVQLAAAGLSKKPGKKVDGRKRKNTTSSKEEEEEVRLVLAPKRARTQQNGTNEASSSKELLER